MGWPNYTIDGKPVCQHIFCDNRSSRMIATHKVSQVREDGTVWGVTLICDQHLPIMQKILHGNDFVEAL